MRAVRTLLLSLLACLAGGAAFGQVQEKKAAERVLGVPDMTLNYDLRKSSFGSDQKYSAKDATVKSFTVEQHYFPKAFAAKPYAGSRESSLADSKFQTTEAPTKRFAATDKTTATKTVPVNDSQYAGKKMDVGDSAEAGKSFFGQGRSQSLFDRAGPAAANAPVGYSGDLKPMTIDDIRTLLNKNK